MALSNLTKLQDTSADTPRERILLVDSDEVIRELVVYNLSADYSITATASAEEALRQDIALFSLIILDTTLKGRLSGLDLIDTLQEKPETAVVPFIICTASDSEDDIITGIDAGADDYIVKPFSLREMVARVKSVLRRHRLVARTAASGSPTAAQPTVLTWRGLRLSPDSRRLEIDGTPTQLSPTEFQILHLFMKEPSRLFSREEIHRGAWNPTEQVSARTIDVNISRLRKKLGIYGTSIVSRPGQGYGLATDSGRQQ